MKILMLAPEPFFQPRGTPISVYFRIYALGRLGHEITLITYPLGKDVELPKLKIIRLPNIIGLRRVKIGPSLAKIPLDFLLFWRAVLELAKLRYDLIFSHEEAASLGIWLGKLWRLPHIYDMHSSLPQQLRNFEFTQSPFLISLFKSLERSVLKHSQAVVVICQDLMEQVIAWGYGDKAVLIENFLDFPSDDFTVEEIAKTKQEIAPRGEKIVMYAGNFETYQGVSLLLAAAQKVQHDAVFLLVGGTGRALAEMKALSVKLGVADKVVFVDRVPPSRVSFFISLADVLVSPRLSGTNTPLKIYSFLKTGKPLVATNLRTHTQVLSSRQAVLADPNPESFAAGISFALSSREAKDRAQAAKVLAETEYTESRYLEKMTGILAMARRNFSI